MSKPNGFAKSTLEKKLMTLTKKWTKGRAAKAMTLLYCLSRGVAERSFSLHKDFLWTDDVNIEPLEKGVTLIGGLTRLQIVCRPSSILSFLMS